MSAALVPRDADDDDPLLGVLEVVRRSTEASIVIRRTQLEQGRVQREQGVQLTGIADEMSVMKPQLAHRMVDSDENHEWMTLRGFVKRYSVAVDSTTDEYLSHLGLKIRRWHLDRGRSFRRQAAWHRSHGSHNLWHVANLADYFRDTYTEFNEERLAADGSTGSDDDLIDG